MCLHWSLCCCGYLLYSVGNPLYGRVKYSISNIIARCSLRVYYGIARIYLYIYVLLDASLCVKVKPCPTTLLSRSYMYGIVFWRGFPTDLMCYVFVMMGVANNGLCVLAA